jgi:hypothetical protein
VAPPSAPEQNLPMPGAPSFVPQGVRFMEAQDQPNNEMILHQDSRFPEGLHVDPNIYVAAYDVLGCVERQQRSYA